jgi:ATP-binding cassette subfamily B multidrug efflux pump
MNSSKNNWSSYLYLRDQKFLIVLIGTSLIASAYLGFITPGIIKDLYQSYSLPGDATMNAIWLLGSLFMAEYFVALVYQTAINKYVQKLLSHIRSKSYKEWMLSIETAGKGQYGDHKYPMGEVLSRILTDTEAVIEMVSTGSFKIFIDFTFIISCLIGFIKLNTVSGTALIIAEVLACIILILGSKKMAVVYMEVRKSTGIMSRVIANISGGFRFSFFHPHENYASKTGYDSFEDFLNKQLKANIWDASYFSLAESLFPILLALLVLIFPYSGIVEMAVLAAIVDLIQRSISPIKEVSGKISSIQRARTGIIRIEEFNEDLQTLPKTIFDSNSKNVKLESLVVKVKEFSYPVKEGNKPFSLKDIFVEALPGQLIGIVGQSGCGKSTLLKLLSTDIISESAEIQLKSQSGVLNFSGSNIESLLEYKSQVSIVSQDSHVFSSDLQFNITMKKGDSQEFHEFWDRVSLQIPYIKTWGILPNDPINPKTLSLGQKQLISALRSCFLTKPIVLFDEISSGLDSDLEEALRKLVLLIQENSLTFIVAHRIETITNAQQILVMDQGTIVDRGTHTDLLKSSAPYQEFIGQLNKVH